MKFSPAHLSYAFAASLTTFLLAAPAWAATSAEERTPLNLETAEEPAKAAAKKAGRPYPNLVDNMRAAKGKSK